jgi:hypothetical protein
LGGEITQARRWLSRLRPSGIAEADFAKFDEVTGIGDENPDTIPVPIP